jgi:hypothetical protein
MMVPTVVEICGKPGQRTVAFTAPERANDRRRLAGGEGRPRLNEWVADFALAGQAALEGPDWASRMVMFRVYYLGLAPYDNARRFLGLSERSWVNWSEEIRRRCGKELLSRGMFPPRKYFVSSSS